MIDKSCECQKRYSYESFNPCTNIDGKLNCACECHDAKPKPIAQDETTRPPELLPCPFCGNKSIVPSEVYNWPEDRYYECSACPAKTWKKDWNTRHSDALLSDLVEAVKDGTHTDVAIALAAAEASLKEGEKR